MLRKARKEELREGLRQLLSENHFHLFRANAIIGGTTIIGKNGVISVSVPQMGCAFVIFPSLAFSSVLLAVELVSGPKYKLIPLAISVYTSAPKSSVS